MEHWLRILKALRAEGSMTDLSDGEDDAPAPATPTSPLGGGGSSGGGVSGGGSSGGGGADDGDDDDDEDMTDVPLSTGPLASAGGAGKGRVR